MKKMRPQRNKEAKEDAKKKVAWASRPWMIQWPWCSHANKIFCAEMLRAFAVAFNPDLSTEK
jgi:hypothetical protein